MLIINLLQPSFGLFCLSQFCASIWVNQFLGGEMFQNKKCSECGSWEVFLIGDRNNSQYFCCQGCGLLLEHTDPKEQEKEKTAVEDLIRKTLAHEADSNIAHKK